MKLTWSLGCGAGSGACGARPLAGGEGGRGAAGELGFVLGLFGLKAGVGAGLHLGLGALELGFALLPALDFGGDGEAVLQGRRVGLVGLGE